MLHHIEISNFRALEKFRMEQLGRVNLLVGTNNSGKTSVLEAISILMEEGSSEALWRSLSRRGETRDEGDSTEFEVEHLFHGHRVVPDATFTIDGQNGELSRRVEARVTEDTSHSFEIRRRAGENHDAILSWLDLSVSWIRDGDTRQGLSVPITKRGGLLAGYLERPGPRDDSAAVLFITTEALSRDQVLALLEDAILTLPWLLESAGIVWPPKKEDAPVWIEDYDGIEYLLEPGAIRPGCSSTWR